MTERGFSTERSCAMLGMERSSFYYKCRPNDDGEVLGKLKAIAKENKRYGYRRAWALLKREGMKVNRKRVQRLWKEAGLSLPRRRPRKRTRNASRVPVEAAYPDHVWTYDFMFDETVDGRKLKFLTIVDEHTRESIAIRVGRRMPSMAVMAILEQLFAERGAPDYLRSDNGPEFIATAVQDWLAGQGTKTYYIDPGSPWQNPYGESFNDKFRVECLDMEIFLSAEEARIVSETWRRHYNVERPHSSLDYKTPAEYRAERAGEGKEVSPPPAPTLASLAAGRGRAEGKNYSVGDSGIVDLDGF